MSISRWRRPGIDWKGVIAAIERGVMAAIRREARAPADRGAVEAGLFERLAVRFAWGCGALAAASGTYAVFLARNLDVEALRLSCSGASYFLGYGLGGAF